MIRLRSTDVWLNYVHGECMAQTLSVRFVVDRPKLHYLDMLWICCGLLLHNCCGLVARLLHNLSWTCRNVNLFWLCCRRCSKLVLLYIFCIFHLVDNYCCSVGELYNKSPPPTNRTNGVWTALGFVRFVVQLVVDLLWICRHNNLTSPQQIEALEFDMLCNLSHDI